MQIDGLDLEDITTIIRRRQGRYLAMLLNELEQIMVENPREYKQARKLILDLFNDYTRSIFRALFGDDIEGLSFR